MTKKYPFQLCICLLVVECVFRAEERTVEESPSKSIFIRPIFGAFYFLRFNWLLSGVHDWVMIDWTVFKLYDRITWFVTTSKSSVSLTRIHVPFHVHFILHHIPSHPDDYNETDKCFCIFELCYLTFMNKAVVLTSCIVELHNVIIQHLMRRKHQEWNIWISSY